MESEELSHTNKKLKTNTGSVPAEIEQLPESSEEDLSEEESFGFPLARIKKIMQLATNDTIRADSVKLITKATELFIEDFAKKAFQQTTSNKKKTLMTKDILEVLNQHSNYAFIKETNIILDRPRSSINQIAMEMEEENVEMPLESQEASVEIKEMQIKSDY